MARINYLDEKYLGKICSNYLHFCRDIFKVSRRYKISIACILKFVCHENVALSCSRHDTFWYQ